VIRTIKILFSLWTRKLREIVYNKRPIKNGTLSEERKDSSSIEKFSLYKTVTFLVTTQESNYYFLQIPLISRRWCSLFATQIINYLIAVRAKFSILFCHDLFHTPGSVIRRKGLEIDVGECCRVKFAKEILHGAKSGPWKIVPNCKKMEQRYGFATTVFFQIFCCKDFSLKYFFQ
jgi:hypothetical protein